MSAAPGTSWQLMLADLSIVLFLTTFSALAQSHAKPTPAPPAAAAARPATPPAPPPPLVAEPVAIWRAGEGPPSLAEWLKTQAIDARMRVNVHAGYAEGRKDAVLAEATSVAADPALAGHAVRLIIEPAASDAVTVTLSFDQTES